jgi:DNA-3-methyladenine glycosylase I
MTEQHPYRCAWAGSDELNVAYHDQEWGRPVYTEEGLFEALTLEGAQAGLSWLTILRKREGYREAFSGFRVDRVARFTDADIDRLVKNPAIVRHRGKIESTINNARCIRSLRDGGTSFSDLIWASVGHEPRVNGWDSLQQLPAKTPESEALSKQLRNLGFRFVGPTTCYAFMQAAGLVNDHEVNCFCHPRQPFIPSSKVPDAR